MSNFQKISTKNASDLVTKIINGLKAKEINQFFYF